MTKQKALELLNAAPGNDKVAKLLALDLGVMIGVMMALNPGCKLSDIAKWHGRVTHREALEQQERYGYSIQY